MKVSGKGHLKSQRNESDSYSSLENSHIDGFTLSERRVTEKTFCQMFILQKKTKKKKPYCTSFCL